MWAILWWCSWSHRTFPIWRICPRFPCIWNIVISSMSGLKLWRRIISSWHCARSVRPDRQQAVMMGRCLLEHTDEQSTKQHRGDGGEFALSLGKWMKRGTHLSFDISVFRGLATSAAISVMLLIVSCGILYWNKPMLAHTFYIPGSVTDPLTQWCRIKRHRETLWIDLWIDMVVLEKMLPFLQICPVLNYLQTHHAVLFHSVWLRWS